jgi:murein L,D-transpeptidase YcbB/YkuD
MGNKNINPSELHNHKMSISRESFDSLRVDNYLNAYNTKYYWTSGVKRFYQRRNHHPAWLIGVNLTQKATEWMEVINNAEYEGLASYDYNFLEIQATHKRIKNAEKYGLAFPGLFAKLDVLLTHAFLQYTNDLLYGKINPEALNRTWQSPPEEKDLVVFLEESLKTNNIKERIKEVYPDHPQYKKLKNVLAGMLDQCKCNIFRVPHEVPVLKQKDTSRYVLDIKRFLISTNDLNHAMALLDEPHVFDEELAFAVKNFQRRHGLKSDGVIGVNTLEEMNKDLNHRIDQVKTNLDRLRSMHSDHGEKYILVNLPEYKLRYYENDSLKEEMKVIIGEFDHPTPMMTDTLVYIEFNPSWNVPYSIASEEMLPKIKKNPSYLEKHNYLLFRNHYSHADTINPDSVEWQNYDKDNFPFHIVQEPGRYNALGTVKFIFPNNEYIYMHDTPSKYLFRESKRDFSHGCVRVEKPAKLAATILSSTNSIKKDSIYRYIREKIPKKVYLHEIIKVYFIYQTAWVDEKNILHFRDDIYGLDRKSLSVTHSDIPYQLNKKRK